MREFIGPLRFDEHKAFLRVVHSRGGDALYLGPLLPRPSRKLLWTKQVDATLAADRSGWVRRTARPESLRVLDDGTVQYKMRQWHGTWRWLVHKDSGSETEGMTTEVADEHSVYIESLGGRYVWDEDRSCWKWTAYVD